jgi:cytoskeletal protein RodZ
MKIGEILKAKRIEKKLTVEAVREATKMNTRYIEALEQGNESVFSAPVYYKAFLRSYAKFLGLDDNALIKTYDASKKVEEDKKEFIESPVPVRYDNFKLLISVILFFVMLAGFIYLSSAVDVKNFAKAETAGAESVTVIEEVYYETTQETAPTTVAAPKAQGEKVKPETHALATKNKGAVAVKPERQALFISAFSSIRAQVISDGKEVFTGTLKAGERQRWFASNGFVLKLGNSSGADVYFNGKKVDVKKFESSGGATIFLNKDMMP